MEDKLSRPSSKDEPPPWVVNKSLKSVSARAQEWSKQLEEGIKNDQARKIPPSPTPKPSRSWKRAIEESPKALDTHLDIEQVTDREFTSRKLPKQQIPPKAQMPVSVVEEDKPSGLQPTSKEFQDTVVDMKETTQGVLKEAQGIGTDGVEGAERIEWIVWACKTTAFVLIFIGLLQFEAFMWLGSFREIRGAEY